MEIIHAIYKITNIINGDNYVGSCKTPRIRWINHKSRLKLGSHHSQYLQYAYNKYGKENFLFEVIEECQEHEKIERENYHMQLNNCAYNMCKVATYKGRVMAMSEEIKEKIRSKTYRRKVYQFALDGTFIQTFDSVKAAMRKYNIKSNAHIIDCCRGKRATACKFRWSYTSEVLMLKSRYNIK